jgi:hypothetical protein
MLRFVGMQQCFKFFNTSPDCLRFRVESTPFGFGEVNAPPACPPLWSPLY